MGVNMKCEIWHSDPPPWWPYIELLLWLCTVTPGDVNAELKQLPPDGEINEIKDGGSDDEVKLQRSMGLWTGVSIIIGSIIGNYII